MVPFGVGMRLLYHSLVSLNYYRTTNAGISLNIGKMSVLSMQTATFPPLQAPQVLVGPFWSPPVGTRLLDTLLRGIVPVLTALTIPVENKN